MKKPLFIISTATVTLCLGAGVYSLWNTSSMPNGHIRNTRASDFTSQQNLDVQQNYDIQQLQQQLQQQLEAQVQQWQEEVQQQIEQDAAQWQQQQQTEQPGYSGQPATQDTSSSSVTLPNNTQGSGNWAGYVDTPAAGSKGYTSVSGSWTVPNISGRQNGVAAQWIGLGGVNNKDLLQMGTIESYQNGQAVANVFWEKLPNSAQNVMTVPIGSKMDARISQASASTWDITFTAHTPAGQTVTKTIPVRLSSAYAQGIGTSAEWISEDPSNDNGNLYPLANMGTVQYSNATVDGQALAAQENEVTPVALVGDNNNVLIAPSSVGSDGESFSTKTLSTGTSFQGGGGSQGYGHHYGRRGRHGQYPQYGYGYGFNRA